MHFIVIAANNTNADVRPWSPNKDLTFYEHDLQTFTILHTVSSMVDPAVIARLVQLWKASFHPSELPITEEMEDAPNAFLEWLEKQPFGYIIPKTHYNLHSFPIYDVVN